MTIQNDARLYAQLQWLSRSPDLVLTSELAYPQNLFTHQPHLESGLAVRARRLGLQFEELLRIYLSSITQVTDLHNNIPIRDQGITLGEADLLFRYFKQWWHLEVALKFYLRQTDIDGLQGYYGPNRRDRFDIKWSHMQQHQTKVMNSSAADTVRAHMGIDRLNVGALIKGWLFQHPNDSRTSPPSPINPLHETGWWVRQSELSHWLSQFPSTAQYLVVEKPFWLHPLRFIQLPNLNVEQLKRRISERSDAVQIWVVLGIGVSRQLLSRGYVVADNWESKQW